MFCYFDPPTFSSSRTPSSTTNILSSCIAPSFLAIGYISAKYVPLDNTFAYRFPYKDFTHPPMVSVSHMPVRLLVWNDLSAFYCLARGIKDERVSLYVVLVIVSHACLRPICHRSLNFTGDTVEWRPLNWNVLACGTSYTVAFVSDTFFDGIKATLTLPIIRLIMASMS